MQNPITQPTILIDEIKTRRNIAHMVEIAKRNSAHFRPHFKTHKSIQVGRWFRDAGVKSITVSSLAMAAYFARDSWQDITIAFPVNILQLAEINELAGRVKLNLMVESPEAVQALAENLEHKVGLWLNVDTGYAREGLDPTDMPSIQKVLEAIRKSNRLSLCGILSHFGHSYSRRGKEAVTALYQKDLHKMVTLKNELIALGWQDLQISIGDTPCCSMVNDLGEADEIRPGTCVFYDLRQAGIGACRIEDISAVAACPVVGVYPQRGEVNIYGGASHLSKDFNLLDNGERNYGLVTRPDDQSWGAPLADSYLYSLSQEIGIVKMPEAECRKTQIGDLLLVYPAHVCLMVSALRYGFTLTHEPVSCMPLG